MPDTTITDERMAWKNNCPHSSSGWCLLCVEKLGDLVGRVQQKRERAEAELLRIDQIPLDKSCGELSCDDCNTRFVLMRERAEKAEAERDALKAVVSRLPKTADGVPIVPGMTVWIYWHAMQPIAETVVTHVGRKKFDLTGRTYTGSPSDYPEYVFDVMVDNLRSVNPGHCYSTKAAALAAKPGGNL